MIHEPLKGNFYAIFPHNFLAVLFSIVFLYAILALGIGVVRFWRKVSPANSGDARDVAAIAKARMPAAAESVSDVAQLRYLGGGHGDGCNEEDDRFTLWRRRFHHFTLYGFLLCFAATCVATLYHYLLNLHAPYDFASLPVILGSLGGLGLVIGPIGLLWLNLNRDPQAWRSRAARHGPRLHPAAAAGQRHRLRASYCCATHRFMALWLAIHLGTVMALFLDAALRQVRPRHLPLRRAAEVQHREAHAEPAGAGGE